MNQANDKPDKQPMFTYSHTDRQLMEMPTMTMPPNRDADMSDKEWDAIGEDWWKYEQHLKSLRTYHADWNPEDDGKEFGEKDFVTQMQIVYAIKGQQKAYRNATDEQFNFRQENDRRIIAIKTQPDKQPEQQEESYPGKQYQRLFDYLYINGFTALQSEMDDIIQIVDEDFIRETPAECDVEGCKRVPSSGGGHWRETGYWEICYEHGNDARAGKPQPKMKQAAIDRENSRDEKGHLSTPVFEPMKFPAQPADAGEDQQPRLIRWANDGYPPIDLSKELDAVLELIKAYQSLTRK